MQLTKSAISAIAEGIATANAHKPAYKAEVLDASGQSIGWVSWHMSIVKSRGAAMRLVTDDMAVWERQVRWIMPEGSKLVLRNVRKAGVTA